MNENLFDRVIKGLEACIREDCENCEYHKNFVHGCDRMIVEARKLILEQQHDLEIYEKNGFKVKKPTMYEMIKI